MEKNGYIRSNIKLIIFTVLTTILVLFSVLFVIIYIDDSENSSNAIILEKEKIIPVIDEDNALSIDAMTYIKNEIIPNVSDVFEYEKVIFSFDESNDTIYLKFIVTMDSFGRAITEIIDTKGSIDSEEIEKNQLRIYELITNGMEESYGDMQDNFNNNISFEFRTTNMTKTQFMYVNEDGVGSGFFQEQLFFDID